MDPRPTPVHAADLGADAPPLASHATFLRSLARNLLFDKSAAGDVAQRALLLALQRERTPADPKSLRAWLAGVVRNLARQSGYAPRS
jgi:DNA-directed RNA polymerase specialized sigma24 family protein